MNDEKTRTDSTRDSTREVGLPQCSVEQRDCAAVLHSVSQYAKLQAGAPTNHMRDQIKLLESLMGHSPRSVYSYYCREYDVPTKPQVCALAFLQRDFAVPPQLRLLLRNLQLPLFGVQLPLHSLHLLVSRLPPLGGYTSTVRRLRDCAMAVEDHWQLEITRVVAVPKCQTACSKNWSVQLGLQCTGHLALLHFQTVEEFHRPAKHLQQWKHVQVHFAGQNCP